MVDENQRHTEKMKKIKAARDKIMATKTEEKGPSWCTRGQEKAIFFWVRDDMRCIAHGMPCAVVQFIKGTWMTGERKLLTEQLHRPAPLWCQARLTWNPRPRTRHRRAGRMGACQRADFDENIQFVLDEINIALRYDYLDVDEVVGFLPDPKTGDDPCLPDRRNANLN